jgi:hypothetical protein
LALGMLATSEGNAAEPKDILWYGNSFTLAGNRSMPNIVSDIAIAAGQTAPRNINAAVSGQSIQWHLNNNTSVITTSIMPGESWEHVVLQDFSTAPTHIGNLSQHISSTLTMYQEVADHSPNVEPIMFETWARGPGHSFYTGGSPSFPGGPTQMQQELRDGYMQSTANINAAAGSEVAKYAPVGDAWENAGFPLSLYAGDIYHAQNRGSFLSALVLYGTIYEDPTTSDIDLSGVLASLGISASDGALLAGIADATMVPEPTAIVLVAMAFAGCIGIGHKR